jgi:uncharacterized membrane protein YgcG
MSSAIDDVSSLPGQTVSDQMGRTIGEIKKVYAYDGDGDPMWVSLETKQGLGDNRTVLVPLARLKQEEDELRVPYSTEHIRDAPELENADEVSEEDDRRLRDHYGIDRADQELRSDHHSYATLVPEKSGSAQAVDDPDQLDTPDADKRDDETKERLRDPGSRETRHVTFDDEGEPSESGRSSDDGESGRSSDGGESGEAGESGGSGGSGEAGESGESG